jgi:site-specific recombinase XerD
MTAEARLDAPQSMEAWAADTVVATESALAAQPDARPPAALPAVTSPGQAPAPMKRPQAVERSRPGARRLHVGHFAFMRAVVQGIDVAASWDRFLRIEGEHTDARVVRSTIAWIRDEFAAAAQRHARFGVARLVRLDAGRIGAAADAGVPTLEAFAAERGLEDFSQAEQVQAFEDEFGDAVRRARRRQRLVKRQLEALAWLETLVAQPPQAGDALASWLNPVLASHLHRAELFTLQQLVDRINGIGQRWYAAIRGLGPVKAERIVAWLRDHEDSIAASGGARLGRHVERPMTKLFRHELAAVVQPATDVRPLEKFVVPAALDGSRGAYRRPQDQCLMRAANDYQAILAWIRSKHGLDSEQKARAKARRRQRDSGVEQGLDWLQHLSHTQRAYRKEAERFLLWAIVQRGKPLSSMTSEDCVAYREFIADPQPRSTWCGPRSRERWSPLWRPFEGPLGLAAQRQAVRVLGNLYGYLVDQNYLMGNPWGSIAVPKRLGPEMNTGRSFTVAQWDFLGRQLEMLPDTPANARLKFALRLLYATGLRLSEAVAATVDDLQWVEYPPDTDDPEGAEGWLLRVVGKGQKVREVPVPVEVVGELSRYLVARGLDADPQNLGNQGAALLAKAIDGVGPSGCPGRLERLRRAGRPGEPVELLDARDGIAANTLYAQLKAFFKDCADVLRSQRDARGAERFARASTHWLRHTHASHALAAGMPVQVAQQNLGHASLATTTAYVTTEAKLRLKASTAFWARRG